MKTTRILLLAAAALALAACGNEEIIESGNANANGKTVPMTFTAGMTQTRTQLADNNAVHWTTDDAIAVWDGTAKRQFTATDIDASRATFTGLVTDGSQAYTAFYPYTDDGTLTFGDGTITFTLPAEQTATAGTFANGLAPSWAQATDGGTNLQFSNLCALVKFTVDDSMAGEGIFTLTGTNATEPLAGSLTYTIADGTLAAAADAATRITLSGTFEAGEAYYFVVAPGTLTDGFSLWYESGEKKQYRRATSQKVTLTAGRILNLDEQALTGFTKAITNTEFIEAMSTKVNWKTEADGTVLLTEANKRIMEQVTSLYLYKLGLTDLSGIEYFTGLTGLQCDENDLTRLDVSNLTKLQTLSCYTNKLTELNVSGLTELTELNCLGNNLTSLDVGNLTALTDLRCSNNNLTRLDVSNLTRLQTLWCDRNNLTELNVSGLTALTELDCSSNNLTELDVSGLTALTELDCSYNELTTLDVSGLTALQTFNCKGNLLTELNVSELTMLTYLQCASNRLAELDITSLTNLKDLYCGNQKNENENILNLILTSEQSDMWLYNWKGQHDNLHVNAYLKQ
ncbi:MAG TPA: leucine-rich repeat domain-containing protein [Bacteroides togonis]|nr:leucine-rich repeat domain-containing protein [Bacteroides togonis]